MSDPQERGALGIRRSVGYVIAIVVTALWLIAKADSIVGASPTSVDLLVVTVFFGLVLVLPFGEVTLGGLTLRGEIRRTKADLERQIAAVQQSVIASTVASSQLNQSIHFGPGMSDSALKELADDLPPSPTSTKHESTGQEFGVDQETLRVAAARVAIEAAVRDLFSDLHDSVDPDRRRPPTFRSMVESLAIQELIGPASVRALLELYRLTSQAIHGEPLAARRVAFVEDVTPRLLAVLGEARYKARPR